MKSILLLVVFAFLTVNAQSVLVVDQYGGGQYITINAALTAAAAGDTIKVMPGLYQEQINLTKKVHFLAMDSTVILDYQTSYTFYFNTGSNGSSLQGFNIRKPLTAASGVKDILIASNKFDSTTVSLALGAGSSYFMNNLLRNSTLNASNSSEKIVIFGNRFENTTTTATLLTVSGGNIIVANNEFFGGSTAIAATSNCNIVANKIYNPNSTGISINHGVNLSITANFIKNAGQQGIYGIYNRSDPGTYYNVTLANNLVRGSSTNGGIYFASYPSSGTYAKTLTAKLFNNIVYGTGRGIYISGAWTANTLFEIKNNIFSSNTNEAITTSYGIMSTDYNCTFNNANNNLSGVGNLTGVNPQFVNPASEDFNLQSSSPCIDAGVPTPQDYDLDRTRNDMGIGGGSKSWSNMHSGLDNARILQLALSPVATAQGNTITITGSGVANKTQQTVPQSNQSNSNSTR